METPQPRQISVSGRLVIEGQLPAPSSASSENAPAPPSPPWWKFWRGPPETVLAKTSGIASLATVVLAAGTVGLALVSYCQLIDSHANADRQLRAFEVAEKRQLRAYISVQPKKLRNVGDSIPVEIFYEVQNSGQTPAFETRFFSTVMVFSYPIPQEAKFPDVLEHTTMSKTVIFPKTTYNGFKSTEKSLTHDELEAVKSGQNRRLYFIGIARYT